MGILVEASLMGEIEIDFSGEYRDLPEFNRSTMKEYIKSFVSRYGGEKEVFEITVYLKNFEASYFGRPLVFCSLAANTEFGLVSSSSTGWGLKQALRQGLKSLLLEVTKLNQKELYGKHAEAIA